VRDGGGDDESGEQTGEAGEENAGGKGEHAGEDGCSGGEIVGAEEDPTDDDEKKRQRALKKSGKTVPGRAEKFVEAEQKAVVGAPKDEGPVGAVPEAAEEHGDQKIAIDQPVCRDAAAAERDVEIIAQAGGE